MDLLAYIALGVLVERYRQHITYPTQIVDGRCLFSTIWARVEDLGYFPGCDAMRRALGVLVDERLVEREGEFLYCFCAVRKSVAA